MQREKAGESDSGLSSEGSGLRRRLRLHCGLRRSQENPGARNAAREGGRIRQRAVQRGRPAFFARNNKAQEARFPARDPGCGEDCACIAGCGVRKKTQARGTRREKAGESASGPSSQDCPLFLRNNKAQEARFPARDLGCGEDCACIAGCGIGKKTPERGMRREKAGESDSGPSSEDNPLFLRKNKAQ